MSKCLNKLAILYFKFSAQSIHILVAGTCDEELHFRMTYLGLASLLSFCPRFLKAVSQNGAYSPDFIVTVPPTKIYNDALKVGCFSKVSFVTRWFNSNDDFFKQVSYVYSADNGESAPDQTASIKYVASESQCKRGQ
jgi:hypothetical protein